MRVSGLNMGKCPLQVCVNWASWGPNASKKKGCTKPIRKKLKKNWMIMPNCSNFFKKLDEIVNFKLNSSKYVDEKIVLSKI